MGVVNNFVIGWKNLAPIFQPNRERPRFHRLVCPCQICPVGKRALVNEAYIKTKFSNSRDGEEIKHGYGKRFLAVFHWLPAPYVSSIKRNKEIASLVVSFQFSHRL